MDVLQHPNPALKQVAAPVDPTKEKDLRDLCKTMARLMYEAPGVGLAATQVGVLKRVIVYDLSEDKPGVILDYDKEGRIVGMEILDASKRVDNPRSVEYAVAG